MPRFNLGRESENCVEFKLIYAHIIMYFSYSLVWDQKFDSQDHLTRILHVFLPVKMSDFRKCHVIASSLKKHPEVLSRTVLFPIAV